MASLEKRIEELERVIGTSDGELSLVVAFVGPGEQSARAINTLVSGGQRWERQKDETEGAFINRASSEAERKVNCAAVLLAL